MLATLALCFSARADENIRKLQMRLQAEGFYHGKLTGNYDSDTAAAVTRYQIRQGLAITGKLDAATSKELGISAPEAAPKVASGTWRHLRSGGSEFVEQARIGQDYKAGERAKATNVVQRSAPVSPSPTPPARAAAGPEGAAPNPSSSAAGNAEHNLSEALRNYVAAFILAGLDPHIGSELEFFGPRVDYFGARNVPREQIERDLVRYDRQWPERRFWLDGDIQVKRRSGSSMEFAFPLRYELRNGSKRASGKVIKNLTLIAGADNGMQIVAVNETKAE
jgi:peptidoglycan hydrolase-like protein with peptidoglycan-binding domain